MEYVGICSDEDDDWSKAEVAKTITTITSMYSNRSDRCRTIERWRREKRGKYMKIVVVCVRNLYSPLFLRVPRTKRAKLLKGTIVKAFFTLLGAEGQRISIHHTMGSIGLINFFSFCVLHLSIAAITTTTILIYSVECWKWRGHRALKNTLCLAKLVRP